MSVKERIKFYLKEKGFSQGYFADKIGVSSGYVNAIRQSIQPDKLNSIRVNFPDLNIEWLLTGEGEMISMEGKPLEEEFAWELTPKEFSGQTPVKVVTTKARGGWTDSFYSTEYLEDLPTVLIETDANYRGKYLAFEVDGDSMEPDYYAGDIVICREVKRDLWRYKLHYKKYDFVIAHGTKGVMIKEIIDHDVENGIITCHSLNNLNGKHNDFQLKLGEIAFLYNIVEVRQKGQNKKSRR